MRATSLLVALNCQNMHLWPSLYGSVPPHFWRWNSRLCHNWNHWSWKWSMFCSRYLKRYFPEHKLYHLIYCSFCFNMIQNNTAFLLSSKCLVRSRRQTADGTMLTKVYDHSMLNGTETHIFCTNAVGETHIYMIQRYIQSKKTTFNSTYLKCTY